MKPKLEWLILREIDFRLSNDPERILPSSLFQKIRDVLKCNNSKVHREVFIIFTTVENRVHEANFTAMDNLILSTVEIAIKFTNAFSGRGSDSGLFNPDQRDSSGNVKETPINIEHGRLI